jgi:hypothetical protein
LIDPEVLCLKFNSLDCTGRAPVYILLEELVYLFLKLNPIDRSLTEH